MRVGLLTVSDRAARGARQDLTGPALRGRLQAAGWQVLRQQVLPDERPAIESLLSGWADGGELDLILAAGGTGFGPRDVTPEATQAVIERPAPGLAEAMRAAGQRHTPHAMLSRSVAGIRRRCLIVDLPGSPQGACESLEIILPALPHAIALLREQDDAERGHRPPVEGRA